MNQDLAPDNAGSSRPRGPCPLVMSTLVNDASIATAIKHARATQLHLLEILKLQELGNSGKHRDNMLRQAIQTYRNNTNQEPSPYHIHAIEKKLFETCVPDRSDSRSGDYFLVLWLEIKVHLLTVLP